eukprot:m.45978 g.45978  ORF g.45978 m.45978 type:complete len:455 (-) comp15152_c1_seq1:894-2258(-)
MKGYGTFAGALLVVTFTNGAPMSTSDPNTVITKDGPVVGYVANDTRVFRGIPYASAPVGNLRLKPPQPNKPWTTPLQATAFGPSCVQSGCPQVGGRYMNKGWNTLNMTQCSEDCLFVNVYVPKNATPTSALPVMVYLHAGEFRIGSGYDQENLFPYFAHGKVILVTGNVRLGVLGFGAADQLRSRDPAGSTGNYGMLDQRQTLRWVQQNIAAFGGDTKRVTIFGESSGGSSVAFHVTSKKSFGLFQRAILESPGLTQSKSFEASHVNTLFTAAWLTAAKSAGCAWPTGALSNTSFVRVSGVSVSGYPVTFDTYKTIEEARTACVALDKCAVIGARSAGQPFSLLGGGDAGSLSEEVLSFGNASKDDPTTSLFAEIRVVDEDVLVSCLEQASVCTLYFLFMHDAMNLSGTVHQWRERALLIPHAVAGCGYCRDKRRPTVRRHLPDRCIGTDSRWC